MEEVITNYKDTKLKPIRRVIAKNMHESLHTMAQLTHNTSFDATKLLAARKSCKESVDEDVQKITINDMILYAVSRVLLNHPDLNAHFMGDFIRNFSVVNLGVAVDTPRGLLVPTIFNADSLSLLELSQTAKKLIQCAQSGRIDMEHLSGGTFTVSNLGALGIESFTPVNNPPQTGILGVCTVVNRLKSDGNVYPAMGLSLTFDHRAVDGAPAARFLKDLCEFLTNFEM